MANYAKLDDALAMALRAYETDTAAGGEPAVQGISVTLHHSGPMSELVANGFILHYSSGGSAEGVVMFRDLGKLSELDQVLRISAGDARSKDLDTAIRDISVRASSAALADGLWHAVTATGAFNGGAKATGAGVIVAVIDTGIDYTHPMFMKQMTPEKKTRILRIWDQGLTPAAAAECPPVSMHGSTERYGVEFNETQINAALKSGVPLAHKDCDGHGTHVAGIAAGGRFFAPGGDASVMGVAPEADIIVVKFMDVPDGITYFTGPAGAAVGEGTRWKDAVLYCLRTARALGKPVVINLSSGNRAEAGDGLDGDAVWADELMNPASAADPMHFPAGAMIVKSAGNDGDASRRIVARISVPASGEVTVPLELGDTRGVLDTSFENCATVTFTPPIRAVFWYRRATPASAVSFALRLPTQTAFAPALTPGNDTDQSFILKPGPPPQLTAAPTGPVTHDILARHNDELGVTHPDTGNTINRNRFSVSVSPRTSGAVSYLTGIYEVKIKAPAGTELFLVCGRQGWAAGKLVFFKVADKMINGSAPGASIVVTNEYSAVDTLGRHAITVAAYTDAEGKAGDPNYRAIASFSSRGPLRDFSDPATPSPVIAEKPDIAAPGVGISSAKSVDSAPGLPHTPDWLAGRRFEPMQGTSMSAPVIAGVVALMLHKKPTLNTTQVRAHLTAAARAAVNPSAAPASTRAYGAGLVDGKAAHGLIT